MSAILTTFLSRSIQVNHVSMEQWFEQLRYTMIDVALLVLIGYILGLKLLTRLICSTMMQLGMYQSDLLTGDVSIAWGTHNDAKLPHIYSYCCSLDFFTNVGFYQSAIIKAFFSFTVICRIYSLQPLPHEFWCERSCLHRAFYHGYH